MRFSRAGIVLFLLMLLAAFVFTLGITWGLPSRQDDQYLLGSDMHGLRLERFVSNVPEVDSSRGADVVAPTGDPNEIVHLNDTDEKRAQILCRYRLYSYQPDEMITFRALSLMKPGSLQFDPRLYQYGGLWIYPVGVLIKLCSWVGLVSIADRTTYIDNPELFGRFYVVARAYSAAWGVVGVWAVFALVRRMNSGGIVIPAIAAICFISMPVVINAAHEAKPHLGGTVLILLAVLAADSWMQTGKMRWAWIAGVLCGAAAGMVLWGVVAVVIIPTMAFLRPSAFKSRLLIVFYALVGMVGVYAITNPYVAIHLLHDPSVVKSNLGNTAGMYRVSLSWSAISNAAELIFAGAGMLGFVAMTLAIFLIRDRKLLPLIPVSIVALIEFVVNADGKPGEYGRLALLPDVALAVYFFAAFGTAMSKRPEAGPRRYLGIAAPLLATMLWTITGTFAYEGAFVADANQDAMNSRRSEAVVVSKTLVDFDLIYEKMRAPGVQLTKRPVLGVFADPAPYCLPPVDLIGWDIVRLPKDFDVKTGRNIVDVIVRPIEKPVWNRLQNPLSWADKDFEIIKRLPASSTP